MITEGNEVYFFPTRDETTNAATITNEESTVTDVSANNSNGSNTSSSSNINTTVGNENKDSDPNSQEEQNSPVQTVEDLYER